MRSTRLTPVPDSEVPQEDIPASPTPVVAAPNPLLSVLLLTLKTLSQKTVLALASCADLLMVLSAFIMWLRVISQPTDLQLIGVGGYGVFVLVAVYMRNRYAT